MQRILGLFLLLPLIASTPAQGAGADGPIRIFLLHNSVGNGLIEQGSMRQHLAAHNDATGSWISFWDHHYPYIGLKDADGDLLGYPYSSVCGHNTDPDGLHRLWLEQDIPQYKSARDSILTNHDVIAFKSCYRATDFGGAETEQELAQALAQYKQDYLEMRGFFDQHPEKVFVVLSPPPRHRLHAEASVGRAAHSRRFADWLQTAEFLGDPPRPNIRVFDLFDLLAAPDDGQPAANMLRYEYELSHGSGDCHPNALGYATVGPLLMQFLIETVDDLVAVEERSLGDVRALFRSGR